MPSDGLSASLERLGLSNETTTHDFDASQKLGMSLTKADDGKAKVTDVAKDGQAEVLGVQVDDVILALDGKGVNYDAVVAGIAAARHDRRLPQESEPPERRGQSRARAARHRRQRADAPRRGW